MVKVSYRNYFFHFYGHEKIPCHVFNYISFILFLITSIKSVYDLIVTEFVYREEPWTKLSLRKLFHFLLPISEITYCVCLAVYGYFCLEIKYQLLQDTIWTSIGGYVLALCFLINAAHWFFLASHPSSLVKGVIIGIIVLFFIIIPFILLVLIGVFFYQPDHDIKDAIHYVELVYAAVLNFIVAFITSASWCVLYRRLKDYDTMDMMKALKRQITVQMTLNMTFFLIRAICLLILGPFGHFFDKQSYSEDEPLSSEGLRNQIIYFISTVLGDIPLAFVMLHFLSHKKKKPQAKSPHSPAVLGNPGDEFGGGGGGFVGGGFGVGGYAVGGSDVGGGGGGGDFAMGAAQQRYQALAGEAYADPYLGGYNMMPQGPNAYYSSGVDPASTNSSYGPGYM